MPFTQYASPFEPLDLSLDDCTSLQDTAHALVDGSQQLYEKFLWEELECVGKDAWALVRERENVRVYRDRHTTGRRDVRRLLTVGKVTGSLNDAMFGELNATTEAMRIKSAYIEDTLLDSVVLETILSPTLDNPFQTVSIRWCVKGMPLHLRAMSKHRDAVFLEATGMRKLSNGETFGYHVIHSVAFDKTPQLPLYKRMNLSMCTLWRQSAPNRVQAFMISDLEMPESFGVQWVVKSMADVVISIGKVVECAQMKKLTWLVERKLMATKHRHVATQDSCCSVCGSTDRSTRRGIKSTCALCAKITCSNCRDKKQRKVFAPDGQLLTHEVRFCLPCLASASCLDATVVAKDEVVETFDRVDEQPDGLRCTLSQMFNVPIMSSLKTRPVETEESCRTWRETIGMFSKVDFGASSVSSATSSVLSVVHSPQKPTTPLLSIQHL